MHTEKEAKKLWCPFARTMQFLSPPLGTAGPFNRARFEKSGNEHDAGVAPCIGSECMAWRWVHSHHRHPDSGKVVAVHKTDSGYCGLVGKPE